MSKRLTGLSVDLNGVPKFSTKHWRPYLKDKPINLTPDELAVFLGIWRERHPDTYAMVALGYMIGARPSSLRPIRYKGPTPDYDPRTGTLVLRRSHTLGEEVMESTKNAEDVTIILPEPMRAILQWHIDTFLVERMVKGTKRINKSSVRMAASELLFPSPDTGSFQVAGRLGKPFDDVSAEMRKRIPGFTKTITPKSMRRTNKDLLRQEGVSQLVAQAINSHHDPRMHAHYSTVSEAEKTGALAKVIKLFPAPPQPMNGALAAPDDARPT